MVQAILSSMDSEAVNSIGDTVESGQVAIVVRTAYFDLVERLKLPGTYDMLQPINSGNVALPTVMYLPTDIESVIWMRYNSQVKLTDPLSYHEVTFQPLDQFMENSSVLPATGLNWAKSTLTNVSGNQIPFYYRTDIKPRYYTSFNNNTILFDAYVSALESTLQGANSICFGKRQTQWNAIDTFIPTLDERLFPLLLNEAKGLAWIELKQMPHDKAEKKSRQALIASQYNEFRIGDANSDFYSKLPSYGRRANGLVRSKRFFSGS